MLQAQVNYWNLVENARHNREMESQGRETLSQGWSQIRFSYDELGYKYTALGETKRHNLITEQETARHNIMFEQETQRHNREAESLGWQTLYESQRHNKATELAKAQEIELDRQNLGYQYARLSEDIRAHKASESIGRSNVSVAQANANSQRIQALNAVQNTEYNNANTQYANRTNRINAYTNRSNALINQGKLYVEQRKANIAEFTAPASYFNVLGQFIK